MKTKSTALGDMHNGKQTCLIQTENATYILKPRSSKTEEAFDLFCQQLNELGFFMFARAPHILQTGKNEHSQSVEKNDTTDENGANLYYKRAGALLFFAYLLGSTDLHCENLVANKDMPVLIDLETLLTGKPRGMSDTYNLSHSVMRSHLLCSFMSDKTNVADVSGFCGVTADMKNIPHIENRMIFLWDKSDIFISSFKNAYLFTLEHKEEISKLIRIFDQCKFRQILRPTKTYSVISEILSKLEDNRQDYATALLSKAYERDTDKNRLKKARLVLQHEVEAVIKNEIPLFYTYGNETTLYCNGQKVLEGHLQLSPVDYALTRLEALSAEDLIRQLKIIALAIEAAAPLDKFKASVHIHTDNLCAGEVAAAIVTNSAVDELSGAFCGLQSDKNGNVDFVSCGYSLYQGLCGVLCMYAALFRKTGKRVYADCLYRYYEHIRNVFFRGKEDIVLTNNNCSLADGLLGVISCLEHIGRLIEDSVFINNAKVLAQRLVLSESLDNPDYLNGVGSLPIVFKRLGVDIPVLLAPLFESAKPFTTGVAHGSSGIALSLSALNATGFVQDVDKKILSVLQWENEQYSAKDHNWFDLRDKTKKGFMSGWCSGAPGIGMTRQHIKANTDNKHLKAVCEADVENVRVFLSERTVCKRDTLCCGASSVLMAASVLGVSVDELYAQLCDAEKNNELRVAHIAKTNDNNVSLMQGLSGVAYALAMYGDALCGGMLI